VPDRSVSVLMTLSDLERHDVRGQIFGRISPRTVWPTTTKLARIARGEDHISRGQLRPYRKMVGPCFPIFGVPFYLYTDPLMQNHQIRRGNTCGEGLVLGGQPRPHPKGAVPQCSPILGVPFYWCIHPLTKNYQIWCGNTWDGVLFLGVSHTPP